MAEDEEKDEEEGSKEEEEEEEDENVLECEECGALYESTIDTRRIANRLGGFVCPRCLVDHELESRGRRIRAKKESTASSAPKTGK